MPRAALRPVLIVEDESIVARDVQQTLAELGYETVATAASAEEAMARARETRPGVALVDIRIKGKLDGIRTAELLEQGFGVPIVYLTAHADDATIERAMQTRPSGFLVKPVKTPELRSALEIALRRPGRDGQRAAATEGGEGDAPSSAASDGAPPEPGAVRRQLEQIFASTDFDASRRSREFLRYVVDETLAGRGEALSQTSIAVQVFGRKDDFDAVVDPIVRIQAGRLRRSLERYYLLAGRRQPVHIELPKGGYAPVFHGATAAPAPRSDEGRTATAPDGWPSLLLHEFEGAGPGDDVKDLALRVSDELALELGRYRAAHLFQQREGGPAPRYPARFELTGRLRREGDDDVRVTARLVDLATGEQIWGDEYHTAAQPGRWSGTPEDVAQVIASRVGAEEGVIVQLLAAERRKGRPAVPTAYDAVLRSYQFFLARDSGELVAAVDALRQVVAAQPDCGPAWARLARLYCANHTFEVTTLKTPLDEAITCAQRGVRLDPASRSARCVLASALMCKGELAASRAELEQALRASPGSLVYLEIISYLLIMLGDSDRGRLLSRSARDRNPHCLPHVLFGLWADHLRRGEIEMAYQAALEYRDPTFFWRSVMRASCLGLLGRSAEARTEVANLLVEKPDFRTRGRVLLGYYLKFPETMDPVVDGLARAGLKLA